MPYKAKKPCAKQGCAKLTDERYCEEHSKTNMRDYNKYNRDPETNKRYGNRWRKIREIYLLSNPLCEICRENGKFTPSELVHHKQKLADGGTNEEENLMSLCNVCHNKIHAEQGDRW